jgi:hypothetical protein
MTDDNACYHCQSRTATCHSTCETYLNWIRERHEKQAAAKAYAESKERSRPSTHGFAQIHRKAVRAKQKNRCHEN